MNFGEDLFPMVGNDAEYSYREGTVLLRLSHHLTPGEAAEYENALKDVT